MGRGVCSTSLMELWCKKVNGFQPLTHYSPVLLFYTPGKQKTFRFSGVFRGYRKATLGCNGLKYRVSIGHHFLCKNSLNRFHLLNKPLQYLTRISFRTLISSCIRLLVQIKKILRKKLKRRKSTWNDVCWQALKAMLIKVDIKRVCLYRQPNFWHIT